MRQHRKTLAETIPCPTCGAPVGVACTLTSATVARIGYHPRRALNADEQQTEEQRPSALHRRPTRRR